MLNQKLRLREGVIVDYKTALSFLVTKAKGKTSASDRSDTWSLNLGIVDRLCWITLSCEGVLCTVGCLAAFLAFVH